MAKIKSDREFQAEFDASTLGEAAVIKSDKQRLGRAKKAATRLAKDAQVKASGLKKVAKTKPESIKVAKKAPVRKVARRSAGRRGR